MAVKASATITLTFIVDISATYRYYKLQESTLAAPAKPTAAVPSGWTDTEPTYTEGSTNSLYICDKTVFTNDTFSYSLVSKSTSYEAAKAAYNKAKNAEDTVNSITIGGRNLIRFTKDLPLTLVPYPPESATGYGLWMSETVVIETPDGLKLERGGNSNDCIHVPLVSLGCINNNETITLSFDYRANTTSAGTLYFIQSSGNNVPLAMPSLTISETEWRHYSWTFSKADANVRIVKSLLLFYGRSSTTDWIEIKKESLKLEKGNTKTDWTPAPEDAENNTIPFILGTQTAATGSWTGVAPFPALIDGQQISYWLPYAGSGNATLNLTLSGGGTTGAINCYYGGTTRLTTHYPAGSNISMVYRSNAIISGTARGAGWWAKANYVDGNDTYTVKYYAYVLAENAITGGRLIVGKDDGWNMIGAGVTFDVSYPILYANASISAGQKSSSDTYSGGINVPLTYYGTWSGVWGKPVYLKGTLSGPTFTIAPYPFVTQDVPSSDDGYTYIRLGLCSWTGNNTATTYLRLETSHPMYRYSNGAFKSFEQIAADAQADTDALADNVDTYYTKKTELEQTNESFTMNFETLATTVSTNQGITEETFATWNEYIKFQGASILLGKDGNQITCRITNDRLSFMQDGTEVAYLSDNQLYITRAEITNRLQVGNFAFTSDQDGGLSITRTR